MDLLTDASIDGAAFKNLDYSKREIRFKEITETTFTHCVFAETLFQECRFHNCVFNKCDLSMLRVKSSQFSGIQFEECKMIGINWAEASWPKSGFLRLIDFNNCTLNYSSFFGLKLKNIK